MFRTILSIVLSAVLLGLSVVKCMLIDIVNAGQVEWLWFGLFVVVGILALVRIIALAKVLDGLKEKK